MIQFKYPKISLLDQLLHRYQGLSRQIKTEARVKPTVVTNLQPAPAEASPTHTHTPTTSLGKSVKVRTRKLPVTPRLSTSKIIYLHGRDVRLGNEYRLHHALRLQHWQKRKRQRLARLWIPAKLKLSMRMQHQRHICPS